MYIITEMNYIFHAAHFWIGVCSNWLFRKPKNLFLTFTTADWIAFAISLILFTFLSHFNPYWSSLPRLLFSKCILKLTGIWVDIIWLWLDEKKKGEGLLEREREREREREQLKSAQCHCRLLNSNFRWNVSISLKF